MDIQKNGYTKKNSKGMVNMDTTITDFIMNNDFLLKFIKDNVNEKIYDTKTYHESMIESVLINDIDNAYSNSYILDYIIDEIDIYDIVYKIDNLYHDDFIELMNECNN